MSSVNLAYKNRVVPIQYQKLNHKIRPLPNQLEEYKGLLLCMDLPIEIPAGHQVLVETGLDIDIPQGLYGELQSPCNCSRLEPLVAPGLILPRNDPEWIRRKVVHLGIKQWNNCTVALLHPDSTSDKDV
ncbi:hypothetical protein DSO57_1013399 [Entomophthora muscae]|uniref:Uncharacterized protein n=1 Tax=Entomophthora muscae TaxID=34485 RepID=A0ACC2RWP1_9FUNG|nr:hypothetical protein DSO57_1013399 [Entomophthora muscae]